MCLKHTETLLPVLGRKVIRQNILCSPPLCQSPGLRACRQGLEIPDILQEKRTAKPAFTDIHTSLLTLSHVLKLGQARPSVRKAVSCVRNFPHSTHHSVPLSCFLAHFSSCKIEENYRRTRFEPCMPSQCVKDVRDQAWLEE